MGERVHAPRGRRARVLRQPTRGPARLRRRRRRWMGAALRVPRMFGPGQVLPLGEPGRAVDGPAQSPPHANPMSGGGSSRRRDGQAPSNAKVFGIGLDKTGLTSLHQALEELGYTTARLQGPETELPIFRALDEGR